MKPQHSYRIQAVTSLRSAIANSFYIYSPKARKTKAKMNYWDFIPIKSCA